MKAKINEIIQTLIKTTSCGQLVWNETDKTSASRGYKRSMYAEGEDKTRFELTIEYKLSLDKWEIEPQPSFFIKNKDLPGGMYFVYGGLYTDITTLRDSIRDRYCMDMNPCISDVVNKLDDIVKGISISALRDGKINSILDEESGR